MCGIAGVFGRGRESISPMLDLMRHRGPDATGIHDVDGYALTLGHVRLSIIDLDARSNQPFISTCRRYALTFNGEIYNYPALRTEMEKAGVSFRTASDTEVLLQWLIHHGADGLDRLEGMFAFCFADRTKAQLLLARDQIGEKPLYYSMGRPGGDDAFAFASEPAALLQVRWVDSSLNPEGLADYLRFLYTAAPHTLYVGIRELPPGHLARFDLRDHSLAVERYYNIETVAESSSSLPVHDAATRFHREFNRSVAARLQSDVPVGLFLSAGMDSNAIAVAMRSQSRLDSLSSFTVRFEQALSRTGGDESGLAAESAAFHSIQNRQVVFDAEAPLMDAAERCVDLFGQPFGNATALVADQIAKLAAEHTRVCLVGDGGDELLVGYPRYHGLILYDRVRRLPRPIIQSLAALARLAPERGRAATNVRRARQFFAGTAKPMGDCYLDWVTYMDATCLQRTLGRSDETEFSSRLRSIFERHRKTPLLAAALVDFVSFIPFNLMQSADRTGMRHSLELRCPFLAPNLISFTLGLPARCKIRRGRTKPLLADAYADQWPPHVVNQPKRPFNPPVASWMRSQWDCLHDVLTSPTSELSRVVEHQFVKRQLQTFQSGQRDNSTFLWGLLSLEVWLKNRRSAARPVPEKPCIAA